MTPKRTKTVVLKPCPFCKSSRVYRAHENVPAHEEVRWIECHGCWCSTAHASMRWSAIEKRWNRRTNTKGKTK